MTPAIIALVLHLASGKEITISQYYNSHNCYTARDAILEAGKYVGMPDLEGVQCKLIKFTDQNYD